MTQPHRSAQTGFTFAELAMAMLVLAITSAVLLNHVTMTLRATGEERDRLFARSKAQAILSEMQGFVDKALPGQSGDLDTLDDGGASRPTLSIACNSRGALVPPDHVLSGNTRLAGGWQWSRRISVQQFPGTRNRNVRYATVQVFKRDYGAEHLLAEMSAVVNAPSTAYPTTQVYDVYLIAIENIPGWWVFMDSVKPFVESAITDLETRNPGLEIRTHWITKAAFGRDPAYRPHFNDAVDSTAPHHSVYYYPGRMPAGSASPYYYVPANVHAHIDVDGVDAHGFDADLNPHPYALCDYWNHALRYPEELALWNARVAAVTAREHAIAEALAAGTPPPSQLDDMSKEPTLRLLLEDLVTDPAKYRNALIVNLHGELLPMPALRNYSDAAKDPALLPEVRVVTHPEQLRTRRDPFGLLTEPATFRVYAYNTYENGYAGPQIMPYPIAVEVLDLDLTDASTPAHDLRPGVVLQDLPGGVTVGGSKSYPSALLPPYGFRNAKVAGDPTLVADEMYYDAQFVAPADGAPCFTRILLYNTPCVAPAVGGAGLAGSEREQLYRMSYVPAPCEAARDFSKNIASNGPGPKNTARWRLQIPGTAFTAPFFADSFGNPVASTGDRVVTVRTRIWTGSAAATSGTMWPPSQRNAPANLSTTYTWWADSKDDVPVTERSQFQGDPRHCPYKDLFAGDPDYPDGWNWFFDDLKVSPPTENSQSDYPAITPTKLFDRWLGRMNCDAPRLYELLRKGIVKSGCVFTSVNGWSCSYLGIGNDVGADAASGYPNSIPVDLTPHGGTGSGWLDTIASTRTFVRDASPAATFWWSMPWLGELCPDAAYAAQWLASADAGSTVGNLTAGTVAGTYYQSPVATVFGASARQGFGVSMGASNQLAGQEGCTAFFDIGTGAGNTFHHTSASGNGALTAAGNELAANYNYRIPATLPVTRPFGVATGSSGGVGPEFALTPYSSQRYAGSLYRTYCTSAAGTGSGLVKLVEPGNTAAGYVVVNGFDGTLEGATFLAKYAVLSLLHSFFEAGSTTNSLRIKQLPRVEIKAPTDVTELVDPETIDIVLHVGWTRWDGQPYTASGSYSEAESELQYVLTWSADGGVTWHYVQDGAPAVPGERPTGTAHLVADAGAGDDTIAWNVPSGAFPQGSYLLRVDCYRAGAPLHYSYHQAKVFLKR